MKILVYCKAAALLALTGLLVVLSITVYRLNATIKQVQASVREYGKVAADSHDLIIQEQQFLKTKMPATFDSVNAAINNVDTTLRHTQTTLDSVAALATELRGTSAQATQAIATAQHSTQGIATAVTDAVQATYPTLNNLGKASGAAQQATARLNTMLQSPDLAATLANLRLTSANMVIVTREGGGILTDTHKVTSKVSTNFLQPSPWYKTGWKYLFQGGTLYWDLTR